MRRRFTHYIRRGPQHPPVRVTLYGKPGCHLCDDAHQMLLRLGRRYPLTVELVDIRGDPALFRQFDIRIPVIIIGGTTLEAPVQEDAVRQALRQARKRPGGDYPSK